MRRPSSTSAGEKLKRIAQWPGRRQPGYNRRSWICSLRNKPWRAPTATCRVTARSYKQSWGCYRGRKLRPWSSTPRSGTPNHSHTLSSWLPPPGRVDVINSFQQVHEACCHVKMCWRHLHICHGFFFILMGCGEKFCVLWVTWDITSEGSSWTTVNWKDK